jgi:hypothetical protein
MLFSKKRTPQYKVVFGRLFLCFCLNIHFGLKIEAFKFENICILDPFLSVELPILFETIENYLILGIYTEGSLFGSIKAFFITFVKMWKKK